MEIINRRHCEKSAENHWRLRYYFAKHIEKYRGTKCLMDGIKVVIKESVNI